MNVQAFIECASHHYQHHRRRSRHRHTSVSILAQIKLQYSALTERTMSVGKTMVQVKTWTTDQQDQDWVGRLTGLHWNATEKKVQEWWQWRLQTEEEKKKKKKKTQTEQQKKKRASGRPCNARTR